MLYRTPGTHHHHPSVDKHAHTQHANPLRILELHVCSSPTGPPPQWRRVDCPCSHVVINSNICSRLCVLVCVCVTTHSHTRTRSAPLAAAAATALAVRFDRWSGGRGEGRPTWSGHSVHPNSLAPTTHQYHSLPKPLSEKPPPHIHHIHFIRVLSSSASSNSNA